MLEQFEDVLRGDHEQPLSPAPADQFRQQQTDLQGLAQPNDVGEQHAWPQGSQRQFGRARLIGERVAKKSVGQRQPGLGTRHRGTAQHRFQVQPATAEVRRLVGDELGLLRAQQPHLFDAIEERGLVVEDELGHADGFNPVAVMGGRGRAGTNHSSSRTRIRAPGG